MTKYAVVDVETTGFGKSDRVVEIAVVVLDGTSWEVIDEFETLINPMRDIGATHVHGVTPSMVEAAPIFQEVAPTLARILGGNVIVAHNLPFDRRFVLQEFARVDVDVDPGVGVCTLRLSGERLDVACERYGIPISAQHRALSDARATADLFANFATGLQVRPLQVFGNLPAGVPRTLRRFTEDVQSLPLAPSRFRVRYPTSDELEMSYLHVLDSYLDDLVLTDDERGSLAELASLYEIGLARREELHGAYLSSLVAAAQRDGIVSDQEHVLMATVATALGIDHVSLPSVSTESTPSELGGLRVCFTGTVVVEGRQWERKELEALAAAYGLQPISSVTKACDLVVAADSATVSQKAQKARARGIPVMSAEEFIKRLL
jgi:DNA polymerase-3 subunit epsilon